MLELSSKLDFAFSRYLSKTSLALLTASREWLCVIKDEVGFRPTPAVRHRDALLKSLTDRPLKDCHYLTMVQRWESAIKTVNERGKTREPVVCGHLRTGEAVTHAVHRDVYGVAQVVFIFIEHVFV